MAEQQEATELVAPASDVALAVDPLGNGQQGELLPWGHPLLPAGRASELPSAAARLGSDQMPCALPALLLQRRETREGLSAARQ